MSADGDSNCQRRSMDAVNKVLLPIRPVYQGKMIILRDKPNSQQVPDFNAFTSSHSLELDEDYFVLTEESLEQYYPGSWKKTADEVIRLQEDRKKVSYAEEVSTSITQVEFETEMPIILASLQKARDRASSNP